MVTTRTAALVGATGLVGSSCLQHLLHDPSYNEVRAIVRRPIPVEHPKLKVIRIDFDRLSALEDVLGADDLFCCLGTTIKKAGSREAFRKVDFDYPVIAATVAAKREGIQFLLVSSLGANPGSRVFYNRVKGEVEQAISGLPFAAVHIFRPSMLLGDRAEFRPAEKAGATLMTSLSFLMVGKWKKYRAIEADVVARAMVYAAGQGKSGLNMYESDVIQEMGTHG
jgi:uncharacterized protein YbjT (DUF2867 family)